MHLRQVLGIDVSGLLRGLGFGEDLRILRAEIRAADGRAHEHELGDPVRVLQREVDGQHRPE